MDNKGIHPISWVSMYKSQNLNRPENANEIFMGIFQCQKTINKKIIDQSKEAEHLSPPNVAPSNQEVTVELKLVMTSYQNTLVR